jgi:hypothetical protein
MSSIGIYSEYSDTSLTLSSISLSYKTIELSICFTISQELLQVPALYRYLLRR